ncbi:hypothetical protein ACI2L4_25065 [Streptomyces sparsogenes]|uniref:hypothetical protein n=1 Tax=Streptomyces sparsogenes TaxID=67365 RepID=UPI00385167B3
MANDATPTFRIGDRVALLYPGTDGNSTLGAAVVLKVEQRQDKEGEINWWGDFRLEHGDERGRLIDPSSVWSFDQISDESREYWAPVWERLAASCTPPADRHWDARGHFEAADGDRVSIMECAGRWAVVFSYKAPHGPQLFEYDDEGTAVRTFVRARRHAARSEPLAYDSREAWSTPSL